MLQHVEFVNNVSFGFPPRQPKPGYSQHTPGLSSAFQRYYYDHGRGREELLKSELVEISHHLRDKSQIWRDCLHFLWSTT